MTGPAEVEVRGSDADLAGAVADGATRLRFVPDRASDLARALGIAPTDDPGPATLELPIDILLVETPRDGLRFGHSLVACNLVVHGLAPRRLRGWHRRHRCTVTVDGTSVFDGRATTVIVASGQFLDGDDLVPRGHPGDGRLEVHVQALAPGARRAMRRRLRSGRHVPHPGILIATGRAARVRWRRAQPLLVDGQDRGRTTGLEARLAADQVTLLV